MGRDESQPETLLVLGGGPKSVALGAKLSALRELDWNVPRLRVIEQYGLAAAWSGEAGFTDGGPDLGTTPIKDTGFPYATDSFGSPARCRRLNQRMLQTSWQAFQVSIGRYWIWVDKGCPLPTHSEWAQYLTWVAERSGLSTDEGRVTAIRINSEERWQLDLETSGRRTSIDGDGLVITGPGIPIKIAGQPNGATDRFSDGRSFWQQQDDVRAMGNNVSIGVLGMGGTAAGIVVRLLKLTEDSPTSVVTMISPNGGMFSRGEGFDEVRMFSKPDDGWAKKTPEHRRDYIRRTDQGVFSEETRRIIDRSERIKKEAGYVRSVEQLSYGIAVHVENSGVILTFIFDYVVNALGFDRLWFLDLMDPPTRRRILAAAPMPATAKARALIRKKPKRDQHRMRLEECIGEDLAVEGFSPRLHVPMLSGFNQGPGFPGLRSLGLMADRILAPYTEEKE